MQTILTEDQQMYTYPSPVAQRKVSNGRKKTKPLIPSLLLMSFVFILSCNENPNVIRSEEILNGDTVVVVTEKKDNGQKQVVLRYKNAVLDGKSETYSNEGVLRQTKTFLKGKEFGSYIEYYSNGKVRRYSFLIDSMQNSYERIYNGGGALVDVKGDPMGAYTVENLADKIKIRLFFSGFGLINLRPFISYDNKKYLPLAVKIDSSLEDIYVGVIEEDKKAGVYNYYIRMGVTEEDKTEKIYNDNISFSVK